MIIKVSSVSRFFYVFLILFIIAFPKGGIKISDIPVTWGYVFTFIFPVLFFPILVRVVRKYKFTCDFFVVSLVVVAYSLSILSHIYFNGVANLGFTSSLIVSFLYFPLFFQYVYTPFSSCLDDEFRYKLLRLVIIFIAIYGIFNFFYKLLTGNFFVIPYLTVNSADVNLLDDKYIDRGGVFKLISTYNNGNIYGVSLLMLLPFYCAYEKSNILKFIVKLSLILTLSRTVWVGLIIYELVAWGIYFRTIGIKKILVFSLGVLVMVCSFFYVVQFLGWSSDFIFDKQLGGRASNLDVLNNWQWLTYTSFDAISEMTMLSFIKQFGVFITILVYFGLVAPLLFYFSTYKYRTLLKNRFAYGVFIYLIVSQSDGAALFIPVMAIYWLCVFSLFVTKNNISA